MKTPRPITIALPIADRKLSYTFYQETMGLEAVGKPAEDGVPEPLQFRLAEHTMLMLIPTGGFGWVIGDHKIAPPGSSEVLLGLTAPSAEEVGRLVERMREGGGKILVAPAQQGWGFTGVAADPDGHAWLITAAAES